ncbi:MAG: hypothetical protein AB7T18_12915, partial [Alphaproteobacteria bacterium]
LEWLALRPRRYAEVREAWASTCPLNCAWEDAIAEGFVRHEIGGLIVLTERGRARLKDMPAAVRRGATDPARNFAAS